MKPKTELQKRVYKLHKKLPKLSKTIKSWFAKNAFDHYIYRTKEYAVCFTCGRYINGKHKKCPNCKSVLKEQEKHRNRKMRDWSYLTVLTTFEGFQVIRCFFVLKHTKVFEKENISFFEIYQHWILPGKQRILMGCNVNGMQSWSYNNGWNLGSKLQIRPHDGDRYYINDGLIYTINLLSEVKRNGYTGDTLGLNVSYFLTQLLCNNAFETLLKIGRYDMIKEFYHYGNALKMHWKQYIICQRHNYDIKDIQMWLDHIKLLKYFKKDISSPKYICPKNLKSEHQVLIERKWKIDKKIQEEKDRLYKEEQLRRDEELKKKYIIQKRKFFDLAIEGDNLKIVPLKSIDEFIEEGNAMHHCVYCSTYYDNENTLILSARKKEKRIETIEFSLKDYKVLQSRGACNQNSRYHKQILNLINNNVKTIKKLARA